MITLLDSVGFAIEDFSALQYVPRDLFGMLEGARIHARSFPSPNLP
jgi:hypothetical protein